MKLIRGLANIKHEHKNCVATIGNFDGIHLGHRAVFRCLRQKAQELGLPTMLITFEPYPKEFFDPDKAPARLTRLREKIALLKEFGVDQLLIIRFNASFAKLTAEEFIQRVIIDALQCKYLIVGADFHFGKNRLGDFDLLQRMSKAYFLESDSIRTQLINNERISSTTVRQALQRGDLELAAKLLGRNYSICGKVIHGDKRGRALGFPTANMQLHRKVAPLQGIYAVKIYGIDTEPLRGVASLGNRPTVDGVNTLLEVYIFNFDRDIYGHYLQVEFLQKIRDEEKYSSLDILKAQIAKDVIAAQQFFEK